jgi:hypothetical protein
MTNIWEELVTLDRQSASEVRTVLPELLAVLQDSETADEARVGIVTLLRTKALVGEALPKLLTMLSDPSKIIRSEVTRALRDLGTDIIPSLVQLAARAGPHLRKQAKRVLNDLSCPTEADEWERFLLRVLPELLNHSDRAVRLWAIAKIDELSVQTSLDPFVRYSTSIDFWEEKAAKELKQLRIVEVVSTLIPLLQDQDPIVRQQVERVLRPLRSRWTRSLQLQLMKSDDWRVRHWAVDTAYATTADLAMMRPIISLTQDEHPQVRECARATVTALYSLGTLREPGCLGTLVLVLFTGPVGFALGWLVQPVSQRANPIPWAPIVVTVLICLAWCRLALAGAYVSDQERGALLRYPVHRTGLAIAIIIQMVVTVQVGWATVLLWPILAISTPRLCFVIVAADRTRRALSWLKV